MSRGRVLIAGCGDLGAALGLSLAAAGWSVTGLRRQAAALPAPIAPLAADLGDPASLARLRETRFDLVVAAGAPGGFDAASYRRVYVDGLGNLLDALAGAPRVLLVSSTGVYHQEDGAWVDEDSPTEPRGFSGQLLLAGERLLHGRLGERGTVLRLGGIYGPGRERLLAEVRAGIGCPREPVRYTNRVHRDDAVAMLEFLAARAAAGGTLAPCYAGVDCEPAPMWEVRHWIAAQLGVALDDARGNADGRGGNKRVSSRRLREAGFGFRYPDYRAGYGALIERLSRAAP